MNTSAISRNIPSAAPVLEEVFRTIEDDAGDSLNSSLTMLARFIIGNRLLIYVAEAGTAGCVEEHLPVMIKAGTN